MLPAVDSNDALSAFGEALKRLPRGTLSRVATATGLDVSYLTTIRAGRREPGINNFARIARALGMSADYLLGIGPADANAINERRKSEDAETARIDRALRKIQQEQEKLAARVAARKR